MLKSLEHAAGVDLAERFVCRPHNLDRDVPGLVRLANEIEAVDQTDAGTSEEQVRQELTSPGFDPAQDGWVVEEPGRPDRLIAEGWSFRIPGTQRAFVAAHVHPAWRRQGLGNALLARAVARARAQGAAYVDSDASERLPASHAFLQRRGFAPEQIWVVMRAPAATPVAAPAWPAGFTVRTYAEGGTPALVAEALNRGFIAHWENRERPESDIRHRLEEAHFRPDGLFLAYDVAGRPAGICTANIDPARNARRGEPVGYIDNLGVVPDHRRRGLGRALLFAGMGWLRANGQGIIELDAMADNERALSLYRDCGFAVVQQGTIYRLHFA